MKINFNVRATSYDSFSGSIFVLTLRWGYWICKRMQLVYRSSYELKAFRTEFARITKVDDSASSLCNRTITISTQVIVDESIFLLLVDRTRHQINAGKRIGRASDVATDSIQSILTFVFVPFPSVVISKSNYWSANAFHRFGQQNRGAFTAIPFQNENYSKTKSE